MNAAAKESPLPSPAVKPAFIDLPSEQLRTWERGAGPTILVLPGLVHSPQSVCARIAETFPAHRVVALELPGLGASAAGASCSAKSIAATVQAVVEQLGAVAGCVALDLSIPVALHCAGLAGLQDRLLLVDLARARWLSAHKPDCGNLDLDADGTYLYKLWSHVRDIDLLESVEPRRPKANARYKTPEELDEAFLCFAVQPRAYADLWGRLANEMRRVGVAEIGPATVVDDLGAVDRRAFSATPLAVEGASEHSTSKLVVRRGYEDISGGRVHYRTSGSGDSCVVALLNGPFSSALLMPLLLHLGEHHTVLVPDYRGQGDSCRSPEETTIARTAGEIDELTRKLGWSRYAIYGTHTGAGVALEMAIAFPDRVKSVVIDSCSMQPASERTEHRARYFPPMVPDVWGSHVFQAWNIQKDGEVFWPWYLPDRAHAKESTSTGLARLHDSVVCTLRSRTTPVWQAMSLYEARNRVQEVHQPVLFVTGPKDIFKSYVPEARQLAPDNFTFLDVPATVWAAKAEPDNVRKTCEIYDRFFRDHH